MSYPEFPAVDAAATARLYGSVFVRRIDGRFEIVRPEDFSVVLFDHDEEESEKEAIALSILRKIVRSGVHESYISIARGMFVFDGTLDSKDLTAEEYTLLDGINLEIDLEAYGADPEA